MNSKLDILIEKYLDGNITKKDMTELNKLVESDKEGENSFQHASALQKLIKQDAVDIEYPEEFFSDVQDLILMKYLQETPQESTAYIDLRNAYPKQLYTIVRYAAVIAILFLASILSINEFMPLNTSRLKVKEVASVISKSNNSNTTSIHNQSLGISSKSSSQVSSSSKIKIARNFSNKTSYSESNSESLVSSNKLKEIINNANIIEEQNETIIGSDQPQLITQSNIRNENNSLSDYNEHIIINGQANEYSSLNELKISNNNTLSREFNNINQLSMVPAYKFGLDEIGHNKINLVANASNSFASSGLQLSGNTITSYSQSISYNLNKKSLIGVELGLTEFSAKVLRDVVLVSGNSGNPDDISGKDLIRLKLPFNQKMQLVWTTIFYERSLFQMENTEISTRLGLGLTNSDPVYMVKIFGKQRIYRDLYLTLGVDTRYYRTSIIGTINGNYLSTFNIIYGLQYSL